jgi:uncharacterized protein YndB with AHSA1/START domain
MRRDIRKTIEYPHPVERVWQAITDREALAEWLMPNDFAPVLGHKFNFRTEPAPGFDGVVDCEVTALEAPHHLALTWRGGGIDTVVRFRLEPTAAGTRLHFEQTGFTGLRGVMVSFLLGHGFKKMYGQLLPVVLDRLARGEAGDGAPLWKSHATPLGTAYARLIDVVPGRR